MADCAPGEAGRQGERLAARFLRRQGFRILRRNCRARGGEIDLIARDGDEVVFVEVKTRTSRQWGDPEDSVTPTKQRRISLAASSFADRYRLHTRPLRFDVVAVLLPEDGPTEFRHYRNAFPFSFSR